MALCASMGTRKQDKCGNKARMAGKYLLEKLAGAVMVACQRQQFSLQQCDLDIGRLNLLQLLQLHRRFLQQVLAQEQRDGGNTAADTRFTRWRQAKQGLWGRIGHG